MTPDKFQRRLEVKKRRERNDFWGMAVVMALAFGFAALLAEIVWRSVR